MKIKRALFTYGIPGFWYEYEDGSQEFSPDGKELTEEQKRIVHSFPCNCYKVM